MATIVPEGMKKWKCNEEVWAAKIEIVEHGAHGLPEGSALLHLQGVKDRVMAHRDWLSKNLPMVGGYYIIYKTGYCLYCPEQEFRDGYTLIDVQNDPGEDRETEQPKQSPPIDRPLRFPRTKPPLPQVGFMVHYTPKDMAILCLAALITRVEDEDAVSLEIFYPKGMFHLEESEELMNVRFDRERSPGTWHYIGH